MAEKVPIEGDVEKVTTFVSLPDEEVDNLRGDVLEEGVDQVEDGGPEELRAEAEDEGGQDGELRLRLLRLLLPVPVPDGDHVGRPGNGNF